MSGFDQARIIRTYDDRLSNTIHQRFFEHSGLSNLGYWGPDIATGRQAAVRLVDELLGEPTDRDGAILDVACGAGGSTERLLDRYPAGGITAINISGRQLAEAERRAPGCRFVVMDACALDFPDATFDTVLCVEAAFHFNTRARFLAEAYRVLRPGGRLALSDILFRRGVPVPDVPSANRTTLEGYRDMLQETGFREIEMRDATAETWEVFERRYVPFAQACLRPLSFAARVRGGVSLRAWQYLTHASISRYLLIGAAK